MEGKMKKFGVLLLLISSFFSLNSVTLSQISLTGSGTYSQNFNTLADTGSSSILPNGWYLFESGSAADSEYVAGNGGSNSGDTYSFGSTDSNSTERALGGIRAGSLIPAFGANFINNTGNTISLLHISYTGEQWRVGATNRTEADRLDFQYSLTAASLSDTGWIDIDQLDLLSPVLNTSSGAKDGNISENRTGITYPITGLTIPDGNEFWIKWSDADISGFDDGLAIDDFGIDLTAPSVTFSITPASLNFSSVGIGNSSTLPVTVENMGSSDNLEITGAVSSNSVFTFLPNTFPVTIPPGNSQVFNVTFTPTSEGPENGTIDFTHNAPGSPTSLSLSGTGQAPTQGGILEFKTSVRGLLDGTEDNADTLVLSNYSGQPLKALQFNLLIGNTNGGLILRSVSRGAAVSTGQFNFSYEIYPGDFLPDGSSIDTVRVIILGNDANAIPPDTSSQEIMKFSYDVVSISGVSVQTFNAISEVTGATSSPVNDANITAGPDETINIFNGTLEGLLGDVNLDDQINILDILLMIDYILERVEFNSNQFLNGDISPWATGAPLPTRDGVIDVLDLAVLQNIVLTGAYPNGALYKKSTTPSVFPTNEMSKLSPGMDAKLTFYLTGDGIAIGLESLKKVKGVQIELDELSSLIPQNTPMTSIFDQAVYYQDDSFLRMLSYDGQSVPLKAGEYLLASIPFTLINPEDIVVDNIIVAGEDNESIQMVETEVRYQSPDIPLDYMLTQNFPNPFNPATLLKFSVPKDEFVTIKVYDMIGQEITTLFSGDVKAGIYSLTWDGLDHNGKQVSSGSYIYRMTAGEFVQSKKMLYIK
jgi:hypothetical protein